MLLSGILWTITVSLYAETQLISAPHLAASTAPLSTETAGTLTMTGMGRETRHYMTNSSFCSNNQCIVYLWSSSHSDFNVKCKKLYYWWGCSYYNVQWCKEGDGVITLYFSLCNVANWIKINGSLNKRCTGVCYSMIPGRAPLVDILLSFKTYF